MNQVTDIKDVKNYYASEFDEYIKSLNGSSKPFLNEIRRAALADFSDWGFPTTDNEEWKYTNVSPIFNQAFTPSSKIEKISLTKEELNKYKLLHSDSHLLVFINGLFNSELSQLTSDKIKAGSFDSFLKNETSVIEKYFNKQAKINDGFLALNTAFTRDGAVIIIPDNTVADLPVQLLFISGSKDKQVLVQPRNLIVVGKNSIVKIIENYVSLVDEAYLVNAVTEINAGENSNIEYYKIQNEHDSAFHIDRTFINENRSSVFNSNTITLGGRIVRNDIKSVLAGETSECHLYGIYLGDGKRHIDNHTMIDHAVPHCHSNELYKGILDESSRGVFNGKVIVHKDAQKTLAYQSNKNLLLSKTAKINTKPQLEIFADDVKCSHGATVGQLDKDLLFYLQSRGISKEKARSILIKAFVNDVIDEIKIEELKNSLSEMILERLHQVVL